MYVDSTASPIALTLPAGSSTAYFEGSNRSDIVKIFERLHRSRSSTFRSW